MSLVTKVFALMGVLLMSQTSAFSQNITILNSQSEHTLQDMDVRWQTKFQQLGYTAQIENYDFLDASCLGDLTDILIVSSAVKEINPARVIAIRTFVESGGLLYVQGEFEATYAGNILFSELANYFGDAFSWVGSLSGDIAPLAVEAPLNDNFNTVDSLEYFWHGIQGIGNSAFQPILSKAGRNYGFIYEPQVANAGTITSISDQDWIRLDFGDALLENFIKYFIEAYTLSENVYPDFSIETDNQNFCQGEDAFFTTKLENSTTGLSYPTPTAYQWMVNGQPISGQTAATLSINTLVEGDVVECVVFYSNGCNDFSEVSNPILMAPVFPINIDNIVVDILQLTTCENATNVFELAITNPDGIQISEFQWSFNTIDLNNTNSNTLTFNDLKTGDQVGIKFAVIDPCYGETWIQGAIIDVLIDTPLEPTVALVNPVMEFCQGSPEIYTITGDNWGTAPVIEWVINGQILATGTPNFDGAQLNPGNHVLVANVYSSETCLTQDLVQTTPVVLSVKPVESLAGVLASEKAQLCVGEPAIFNITDAELGDAGIVSWLVDGSMVSQGTLTYQIDNPQDGQIVTAVITTSESCYTENTLNLDPITLSISENQTPYISIDADALKVCPGQAVSLQANGDFWGDNPVINWVVNGVTLDEQEALLALNINEITTTVAVQITSDFACLTTEEASSEMVVIESAPMTVEVMENSPEHCGLGDGKIEVNVLGGFGAIVPNWDNEHVGLKLENLSAGQFAFQPIDSLGCQMTKTIEVLEEAGPEIESLGVVQPDCDVQSLGETRLTLMAPVADLSVYWMDEYLNEVAEGNQALELAPGNYSVEVMDGHGCLVNESFTIEEIHPIFVTDETAIELQLGDSFELNPAVISNDPNINYSWSSNIDQLDCENCEKLTIAPLESSRYELVLTNSSGCTETIEYLVRVRKNYEVFLPNVFSPNGDGSNDFWNVFTGNQVASVEKVAIYNRWGAQIYAATDVPPNNVGMGWDGTFKGKAVGTGVYIATVEVIFQDGNREIFTGDVSLLR